MAGLKLRKNVDLSSVPGVYSAEKVVSSTEALIEQSTESYKDKYDRDCGDQGDNVCQGKKRRLNFSKIVVGDKSIWTFFLNVELVCENYVNAFIVAMSQVQPEDVVVIHGPACLERHYAEALYSSIKACPAIVIMSNPYILDVSSAYLLTAADKIMSSPYIHMRITSPRVGGFGGPHDAQNSINYECNTYFRMYEALKEAGFLTDEQLKHLTEEQGMVSIDITDLITIINKYNERPINK